MPEQEGPWFVPVEEYRRVEAERDRARATAVRLEQELSEAEFDRDRVQRLLVIANGDAVQGSRRARWLPDEGRNARGMVCE